METRKVTVGQQTHESATALGIEVSKGYLFWVKPDSDDDVSEYGYHGLDFPPCTAAYLADNPEGAGYLVISGEPELPECVEGWSAEKAALDEGWFTKDESGYAVCVMDGINNGFYTVCGLVMA